MLCPLKEPDLPKPDRPLHPRPRPRPRPLKWLAAAVLSLLAAVVLALLVLAVVGWNWARGPLQDLALEKTGRALLIGGDLNVHWAWPAPRLQAQAVQFANPPWASAPQMLSADEVDLGIDLSELLRGRLAFTELRLTRPRVFLEQASGGRKTWLLDRLQTDESARLSIERVQLDQGELSYVDPARKTAVQATLSTVDAATLFNATGQYEGQPLSAEGSGGPVLALRDQTLPYPLKLVATLGRTRVQAEGSVTGLLEPSAVDLQIALQGDSLASLFPIIGIGLPRTPAYRTTGHLVRSGTLWRYDATAATVGHSDLAGSLQVETAGARPMLSGALTSRRLDLADLGPAIGAAPVASGTASKRVLPELPLATDHWDSVNADVTLKAKSLVRDKALPLENLQLRLRLDDRLMTLDPLDFGLAGGRLKAQVTLDSRSTPLRGKARLQLRGVQLGKLLPTVDLSKTSIGQLNGDITLAGQGASVGRMLATADGRVSLVAQNGEISRLMMEQIGLHLLEILQLNLTGDRTVPLRCAVADFDVARGVMQARALVLDTSVNTVVGNGQIDLAKETFDLRFVPRTKVSSLVALRGPVYVTGPFAQPVVRLDTARIVARGAGALALGLLNPLLALLPLFEAGPGADSPCAELVREAQSKAPPAKR